jgi:DNA-binding response OmpR family regulator
MPEDKPTDPDTDTEAETEKTPDRVLLVDDNLVNLQVLYQALEEEGYELLLAQSGAEALDIAHQAGPAVILLDINMPEMDGYETCRRLKAEPQTQASVIAFLSARADLGDKLTGFDCGAVDYIEKPFQFEEVVARVKTYLASFHRDRELERATDAAARGEAGRSFRDFSNDEPLLRSVIAAGEGDRVEFKSTLRWNLHIDKADKRIENACLKTIAAFLNSDGGLLLVGVDDEGQTLGLKADSFANHDKLLLHLTALINNHIGTEFAPFIRASIVTPLDDSEDVLSVECLPSPHPVYFRRDQDEIFYVRSGPATQKLSPSAVVAYVSHRKGA